LSDTTNQENVQESNVEDFLQPEVAAAREAGVPDLFDNATAVFIHRTAANGGYVLAAFDPAVLVRWADAEQGFRLLEARLNFLPYGMPVLGLGLEDLDATPTREEQEGDKSEHQGTT
jgi:hypothetical protein